MVTIPKYVYEDLKHKAQTRLRLKFGEIMKPFEDIIQKQKDELDNELKQKIILNPEKYNPRINVSYDRDPSVKLTIPQDDYDKLNKKRKELDDKISKLRRKVNSDLDNQLETWAIDIYIKASDGQIIKLPVFKIDKSKYKL